MVGLQQSAQTLNADDLTLGALMPWLNDLVGALMNPFATLVLEILGQDSTQIVFRRYLRQYYLQEDRV